MTYPRYNAGTHVRVYTTNRNREHAVEIHGWENDKSNQIAHGEDSGEETCLDCTTNESIQNCIRLSETSSRTREDEDQSSW